MGSELPVDGTTIPWWHGLMTMPFNITSRLPVPNVPSGRAPNGASTGARSWGRVYDDVSVFRAGSALEAAQDLWGSPSWRASGSDLSSLRAS